MTRTPINQSSRVAAAANGRLGKILVVDDEPELKAALVDALSSQGYEARGFSSGSNALLNLRDENFDLLLTDLMMPEMDGITLLQSALEIDPNLVPLIMTGQGTIQTAVDAMKVGAFDYVLKPFRIHSLMPVLTRAMNMRHLRLENVQLREAVAIHELSQTIAFTLDPQTVLSKLADTALQQSEADEVSVLLPTADGCELYVAAVRGPKRERLLGERIPFDESIASWVGRKLTPVILNGEVHDDRFVALWPRPDIRSSVSVPMQVANKLLGVLNVNIVDRPRPFTLGQMKGLSILAGTAAAALESASLYSQVREAEKNYRSIFENAVEGMFQATPEGRFITVNPSMAAILGYESPEELLATLTDVTRQLYVHPEDRAKAGQLQDEHGVLHGFEFEAYRRDGEKIWLSLNRRSGRDENGVELYREGSIEDITERKRAEEDKAKLLAEIENQRQRLDTIVANVPGVVWEAWGQPDSGTQRINFVSDYVEKVLGYSVDEWLSTPQFWLKVVHPDDRERVKKVAAEAFARCTGSTTQFRWVRKDGSCVWVESTSTVISDESGKPVGVRGVTTDISEREQAIQALRESETRFRMVAENLGEGIFITDLDDVVLYANSRISELIGYSREELLGTEAYKLLLPPDEWPAFLLHNQERSAGQSSRYELLVTRKEGERIWLEVNAAPYRNNAGEVVGTVAANTDITERKRAEEALRESEQRYRDLVENAQDIIYSHDLKGNYTDANRAGEEITGYTLEESLKLSFEQTIAPEYQSTAREMLARKLAGENITAYEVELMTKDGRRVPVEVNTRLVFADGVPIGVTGIARDITERKRAEADLAMFRRLVDQSNDGIYVVDIDTGCLLDVNETACRQLGYARDELLKLRVMDLNEEMATPTAWEEHRARLKAAGSLVMEFHGKRKDGSTFPVEASLRYVALNDRQYALAVIRDITERKTVQAELNRLATAVEQTGDSIVITDTDGNIEYVNPAFERITGYTKEEALGQNPRILKSGKTDPSVYRDLWETIVRGGVWSGQLINRKKDGTLLNERATISAVLDDSGKIAHYIAVKQDTTHEIQLEEQLRQSQKLEAIGQLAGGVAHDFNNLLTVIGGYSSLLLGKLSPDSPYRTGIEEIKKAGDRAGALTRQLLAFSRKQILQPKVLDLNTVVTDLHKMVRRLIGEDIDLLTVTAPALGKVKADPGQIEQVLLNLIVNARDAMPQGGQLTIETRNFVLSQEYADQHAIQAGRYVMLAVSDTGCGMDATTQARIFEPFFTTKSATKGTGLGLATVYGIVKQSGGNIWVYSELGKGSTFKVYLPRVDEPAETEDASGEKPLPRGTETILLVEDEDPVRAILQQILEGQGYQVLGASNGEDALSIARERQREIRLMITDVVMPQMSGRELAEHVLAIRPGLRVLFMSGYTDDAIVRHGLLDEKINFIQKPFESATVARKVREVLDSPV